MKRRVTMILVIILLTINIFTFTINISVAGTIRRVPEEYSTIQAAINAASPGDIIQVANGTYYEHIVVNKSIILRGNNRASIIDGQNSPPMIINLTVGNVEISGFTIQNGGSYGGIWASSPTAKTRYDIVITNNALINDYVGVYFSFVINGTITNNDITNCYYGIRLHESDQNTVMGNNLGGIKYYAVTLYAHSNNNKFMNNTVKNSKYGVLLEYSDENTLSFNTVSLNTEYGIRLSYSSKILVKGNNLMKNKYGVFVWNCSGNTFYYNNFIDNTIQVDKYDADLTKNTWDTNVHPGTKGNYWSDYTGVDDGTGVGRWGEPRVKNDGIGDTKIPHSQVTGVSWFGLDWYPLMYPWTPIPPGPAPVAIFTWNPLEPIYNQPATFNASKSYAINGTIISYQWNFGDGNTTLRINPIIIHTFAAAGNYNVTLTVTANNTRTGSTWHIVKVLLYKLEIDVYTQQPEPYGGRGPNQPSDAFSPQEKVFLYAEVTYNYDPAQNKPVRFVVTDPEGGTMVDRSSLTNAEGVAEINFTLPTTPIFGTHTVLATVSVAEKNASDTLTFEVGWIIEIMKVETVDQYGNPKNSFAKGENVYFDINLKNIAFTPKNVTLTMSILDEGNVTIGVVAIKMEVAPRTHEFNLIFNIKIPEWSFVGSATAVACAFTNWPWIGGIAYCPENLIRFYITKG